MREISTCVDINVGASLVWDILTDFGSYRRWNPLIHGVQGFPRRGNTITLTQRRGAVRAGQASRVTRTIKHVREPRELHWCGTWALASWFSSERRFRIESLGENRVRLHQCERFRGIAVPFLWRRLQRNLFFEFGSMNRALKARAELAQANFEAMRRQSRAAA